MSANLKLVTSQKSHLVNLKYHEKAAFAVKMEAVASAGTFVITDYPASHHRQFVLILTNFTH
jgi:hypothetical protein